ncbi:hypothetical protein AB0I68_24810 [Streptomyces sp. NPDC050448]|uniref:hypothetical protein n=1 Tax=Streptomyces sp. NPDC050448 TaxID=3155404 RepID=UPI003448669B
MGQDAWIAATHAAGWMATVLDLGKLADKCQPGTVDVVRMIDRDPDEVAAELGRRYLLHYVHESRRGCLARDGGLSACYATPTPYSPEEASQYLALPVPENLRRTVFYIDLSLIKRPIRGPAREPLGGGVQYYLPQGCDRAAIETGWEVTIR